MTDTADSNREFTRRGDETSAGATPAGGAATCPACGAAVRRPEARFCATCGRNLAHTEYLPSDTLRASYHYQRTRPPVSQPDQAYLVAPRGDATRHRRTETRDRMARPAPRGDVTRHPARGRWRGGDSHVTLKDKNNGAAATALALVTYALVPYLGILFCPGAVLMGGVGLWRARRAPYLGGRRAALLSVLFGIVILCAQIFLWWILYKVPEWSGRDF